MEEAEGAAVRRQRLPDAADGDTAARRTLKTWREVLPMDKKSGLPAIWIPVIVAAIGGVVTLMSTDNPVSRAIFGQKPSTALPPIQGSVMVSDMDPAKRAVLQGVEVIDTDSPGLAAGPATTNEGGSFVLHLRPEAQTGQTVFLQLTRQGYQTVTTHATAGDGVLYTFYLWPNLPNAPHSFLLPEAPAPSSPRLVQVAYAPPDNRTETFQVPNRGSVRCNGREPCDPDHKWKASIVTSPPLDAGPGNVFLSGHAECIAGPCAWTRIEDPKGTPKTGQRMMTVTVRNWSDTTTYRLSGVAGRP